MVEIHLHPGFWDWDQVRDQVKMMEIAQNISDLGDLRQLIYGLSTENWDQVRDQVDNKVWISLKYCKKARFRNEILNHIGLTNKSTNFKNHVYPLIEQQWLKMTIPEKPTSSKQQYILTEKRKKTNWYYRCLNLAMSKWI